MGPALQPVPFLRRERMEEYFWFALRSVPLVGNITFRRLVERFGSPRHVLEADPAELSRAGLAPALVSSIQTHDYRALAERECLALEKSGARVITLHSTEYPPLLLETGDPPPLLYVKGSIEGCDPAIAIVGSRRATSYGLQASSRIAVDLAGKGITVVSGMARGIDTAAHQSALQAGGRSIGVLGCGIDIVYPAENRRLFAEMAEKGALLSEFPLGTTPLPANFPRRNRIISGLSRGVLVVEAAEKSGSLITAQFALEQGREVFAIPGSITSGASRGTNRLIKQGATLVEDAADILAELPPTTRGGEPSLPLPMKLPAPALEGPERAVCDLLGQGPLHMDTIAEKAGLTVQGLSVMLLRLELRGVVLQLPGAFFTLA
jgi:DNA processing protein